MGSPVSPIVANLYMEEVEHKALTTFSGVAASHWFRYVDDTWVKIRTHEVEAFSKHISTVDININFTQEDVSGNNPAFLDCDVHIRQDRSLSIEVYRNPPPPQTSTYSSTLTTHWNTNWGSLGPCNTGLRTAPTTVEGKEKEQNHIKKALQNCGYPNWAFLKSRKRNITGKEDNRKKRKNIVIPYISGLSEKLRRIFYKHNIPVHFRPSNTLKQKLVHPKDRHKQDNVVYAIQCSEECTDSYIGETKQPLRLHRCMAQHRRASSSDQDSVYLHLNNKGHSFQDCNVRILARQDRWYERGVKEAIFVNLERPSPNRGGGLRHHLSATYNAVLVIQGVHEFMIPDKIS
ncbi:mitochondrial outer membrane protein SLC25A46 isoform X1 [Neoarius graeffei]|uniref:mitochondrial outer membrane protein SLC25A46 isoform X1 n=1 Tax=Neoarius graeffei TaxID=443677 RepID=UPI00298CC00D|nr:mitochondrial outer membrane protein SLC25A46 isoform X1 [Neoarius graeffei]